MGVQAIWLRARLADDRFLFHVTDRSHLPLILSEGLAPAAGTRWDETLMARSDCVYLADRSWVQGGWLVELTDHTDPVAVAVRADLLDPALFRADEDGFNPEMGALLDPADFGVAPFDQEVWASTGEWARCVDLGAQPGAVEACWVERGTVAYRGPISPEALVVDVAVNSLPT